MATFRSEKSITLPGGVMVTHQPLELGFLVRVQARELEFLP